MRADHISEFVTENFPALKCDKCGKTIEEDGETEGYFIVAETDEDQEKLEKQFPNVEIPVVFVCETCLYATFSPNTKIYVGYKRLRVCEQNLHGEI